MSSTPTLTPRQRRREANLVRIESTAMELIVEDGVDGLSIHRLARQLGFTPGALYRYFDSKEALLATLLVRVIDDFATAIDDEMADKRGVLRVIAATRALTDLAFEQPHRFGLLAQVTADPRVLVSDPGQSGEVMQRLLAAMAPLAAALEGAVHAGELQPGDAIERAVVLFTALQGVLNLRKQERHALPMLDVTRLSRSLVHSLLIGWGAAPSTLEDLS